MPDSILREEGSTRARSRNPLEALCAASFAPPDILVSDVALKLIRVFIWPPGSEKTSPLATCCCSPKVSKPTACLQGTPQQEMRFRLSLLPFICSLSWNEFRA